MPEFGDPLSERETELLELMATGVTNREIAYKLHISVNTVKVHARNIFVKVGAESRTEATLIAVRQGLIDIAGVQPSSGVEEGEENNQTTQPSPHALPWSKRAILVGALLLVAAILVLTWPRSVVPGDGEGDDLPPEQTQEQPGVEQVQNPGSHWHPRAQMPTPRAYLAAAAVHARVLAIGGRTTGGSSGVVEIYEPAEDIWSRGSDKPTPVAYVSAAVLGDEIYVPGGCDTEFRPTAVVEAYDPVADVWRTVAPLPEPRCAYALGAEAGRIYLFGGRDGERYVDDVYVYDPQTDTWSEETSMGKARGFASLGTLDGQFYVVGGYDGDRELTTCEAYNPETKAWAECAPLTVGRGSLALASLADRIYAIGGGGWTSYLGFNESYNPQSNAWSPIETPLTGEWRSPGLAVLETTLYAIGGWSGRYLSTNQAYEALPYRLFIPVSRQE